MREPALLPNVRGQGRRSLELFALALTVSGCVIVTEHPVDSTPPPSEPPKALAAARPAPSAMPIAAERPPASPADGAPASDVSGDAKPLPKPTSPK